MRIALAWVIGNASFIALFLLIDFLGGVIGVPVQLQFGETIVIEHQFYDEERDSAFTTYGLATTIICMMFAARIGMAINAGSWRGNVDLKGEIQFRAWLMGLAAYGTVGVLVFLASRGVHNDFANIVFKLVDLAFALGIAWAMRAWHDHHITNMR